MKYIIKNTVLNFFIRLILSIIMYNYTYKLDNQADLFMYFDIVFFFILNSVLFILFYFIEIFETHNRLAVWLFIYYLLVIIFYIIKDDYWKILLTICAPIFLIIQFSLYFRKIK